MIWAFIIFFLATFAMGVIGAPQCGLFVLLFLFLAYLFIFYYYPVLFGKNADKIKQYLRKSKISNYHFIYQLLYSNEAEAEKTLNRIKQKTARNHANVMLLTKQKKYKEAKAHLSKMKDNKDKSYYGAVISLHEGNQNSYNSYKEQIKDTVYLSWLEAEELVLEGYKNEAIAILDEQIKHLRGLKLLSAVHYRDSMTQDE
ncbi:hypothetical protein CN689_25865 [Peribacillus butanolivorans]|uniref:Uncharacterized protein n=1 Tax=Peribacillus butanolivorans TaxID=421767 RepID=A0AAX0RYV7_9BACI|nr:hypothetical protein [Peribacillus butanolivorans]AXN40685.1 hypothetical protein DTO10_21415 [Peribacillus butanolivorans]PEJ25912.1 hypothetical protein CN689_25865 [Peribacillus butanolivorans]